MSGEQAPEIVCIGSLFGVSAIRVSAMIDNIVNVGVEREGIYHQVARLRVDHAYATAAVAA